MLARFGQVLYWAACGVAALVFLIGLAGALREGEGPIGSLVLSAAVAVVAGVIWLIGRALLYILSNK
jgi:hypothetical protein